MQETPALPGKDPLVKRTLTLKKDTLTELTTDDLRSVAGGGVTEFTCTGYSLTACTVCTIIGGLPDVTTVACAG
jgi:hypothetical protein